MEISKQTLTNVLEHGWAFLNEKLIVIKVDKLKELGIEVTPKEPNK